jgi:hypothetical protein
MPTVPNPTVSAAPMGVAAGFPPPTGAPVIPQGPGSLPHGATPYGAGPYGAMSNGGGAKPSARPIVGGIMLLLAGALAGISLGLPYYEGDESGIINLFGDPLPSSYFFSPPEWPLGGVPLGYFVVVLILTSLLFGILAVSRSGSRLAGALAIPVGTILGGLAGYSWWGLTEGEAGPNSGSIALAVGIVLGIIGGIVVASSPSAPRQDSW